MELIDALDQTFQHAQGVIGNVRADQYDDPTPCPDWTVRDLLSHTIGVVAGLAQPPPEPCQASSHSAPIPATSSARQPPPRS
jgi:hypothetical protein